MRYYNVIAILALLMPLIAHNELSAQENKRVEITATYRPEISPATKLTAPTDMDEAPSLDIDIDYDIRPDTWSIDLKDHNFDAASATYWDYNRARPFYLRLGAGAPLGSDVKFRYLTQNSRVGYFGIGVDHDGGFTSQSNILGVDRPISQSYDMRNSLALNGGAYVGRQMFEASLSGSYDVYNRYAELSDNPFRAQFGRAALSLSYGDDFSDLSRLNFAIEAHGDYWMHPLPMTTDEKLSYGEYNAGGSVELGRAFSENYVGINLNYDMWAGRNMLDYRNVRFGGGVEYARHIGVVDLELGVGYLYDKVRGRDNASHFVLPHAKLLFDLRKASFAPYIEFDTEVSQNSASALYDYNPYIAAETMNDVFRTMPNSRSYNLVAGFTGTLASARFAYRAYVGGEFARDYIFWYVASPGLFGAVAADNNRLRLGAELEYRPVGNLLIGAGVHYHLDFHDKDVVNCEPEFVADALVEYRLRRWTFYVMSDIIGSRSWAYYGLMDEESNPLIAMSTPVKIDLRAGISFRVSHTVDIYVDGYNLLNRTDSTAIYDWAYYYRNGIGFMAGVKLNF